MIVVVDLNPSLDRTLTVARLEPGVVNRAHAARLDPGGKGLNVARALSAWGVPMAALTLLGGGTGSTVARLLEQEQVPCQAVPIAGETRSNVVLIDEARGTYVKVNEPGPLVTRAELDALERQVKARVQPGELWVYCGRLPPGAPPDTYARLIQQVQARGARALLDASGETLRLGVAARPYLLKPNQSEAEELLGRPLESQEAQVVAIRRLWAQGIALVAITRGAAGMLLGWRGTIVEALPPAVEVASHVGPGDAAMAALAWGLLEELTALEMARLAVAAGAATVQVAGTGMASLGQVQAMREWAQAHVLQ